MNASALILPIILSAFSLFCVFSKNDTQNGFISGAKEGLNGAFSLIPTLVLLLTAVSMFSASGAAELLAKLLSPVLNKVGVPSELAPLLIVRPLSGSGATALLTDVFEKHGPDSFIGICASVISGSSDTVFYVTALYMSGAGATKSRYTLPCAIAVMIFGILLSCLIVRIFA
ncbi:MAG: spore maturation protein [Ruminococcaceae bacterium]|nr:spore maturation protein [Oscillospiraceae bacterium]